MHLTKTDAFNEINKLQNDYVDELIGVLNDPDHKQMKAINFTSATGTGKTKMMSILINKRPEYYYIVTTLSKGQLHLQVRNELEHDCHQSNFYVYGSADYRINSKLDAEDIIQRIPPGVKCIWLRDEGHIKTNRWDELLLAVCDKVVNFSATNTYSDVSCNFTQTMMLRTVNQTTGTPEDAILKLLEIKRAHKKVKHYNPCAIFRCINDYADEDHLKKLCEENNLKYINITDESYIMSELCEDDNEFDVIINKFKIQEGIDIRRAHVLYMDNQPNNNATTIQAIGRCRRNALLYREDIDILAPENEDLLKQTRECFVFYNVENMKIDTDENGELYTAFCDHISCESIKENSTIEVENGQLPNGLYILELEGQTGTFQIKIDKNTGFNVVEPITDFYQTEEITETPYLYSIDGSKIHANNAQFLPKMKLEGEVNYLIRETPSIHDLRIERDKFDLSPVLSEFRTMKAKYTETVITERLSKITNVSFLDEAKDSNYRIISKDEATIYILGKVERWMNIKGNKDFFELIRTVGSKKISFEDKHVSLDSILDDHSIILIKYYLIKQKEADVVLNGYGKSMEASLNRLIRIIEESMTCNFESNWHVVIDLLLNPQKTSARISNLPVWSLPELTCKKEYNEKFTLDMISVQNYFSEIEDILSEIENGINKDGSRVLYINKDAIRKPIIKRIEKTEINLENNTIDCYLKSYKSLFEPLTEEDKYLLNKGFVRSLNKVSATGLKNRFSDYKKIVNDRESAIIGTDLMRQIRIENEDPELDDYNHIIWVESTSVTSKVGNYNKLNTYISKKYSHELKQATSQCFTGKNNFEINKRCNSMIGYCVEYYSKYLLYGEQYLQDCIQKANDEYRKFEQRIKPENIDDIIIVRACMFKYKEMMIRSFGNGVARLIKGIPIDKLAAKNHERFVNLIMELGSRTAVYVKNELYSNKVPKNNIDPNLSIRHISGLADYITEDTILDVKVRNNIDNNCVRQVLAYHYLSTKRSDLCIKRVVVYDAVSDRAVVIKISDENIK